MSLTPINSGCRLSWFTNVPDCHPVLSPISARPASLADFMRYFSHCGSPFTGYKRMCLGSLLLFLWKSSYFHLIFIALHATHAQTGRVYSHLIISFVSMENNSSFLHKNIRGSWSTSRHTVVQIVVHKRKILRAEKISEETGERGERTPVLIP